MPHSMVWMPTDELIDQVPCTCIDGRTNGMRYSAAGGSLGLIIHLLAQLETKTNSTLDEHVIASVLFGIAKKVSPVYLHTDQHALDLIYARLGLSPVTKLRSLTETQQRSFITLATQADYQGCGHLKLMMNLPEKYQTRFELTARVLKQFYRAFFEQKEGFYFDVLAGQHQEEQMLIVEAQPTTEMPNSAPLYLEDKQEMNQFFCHRPLKRELLKRFNAELTNQSLHSFNDDEIAEIAQRHDLQAEHTLHSLAGGIAVETLVL